MEPVYEQIGSGYRRRRRAEPRWEARITAALGSSRSVVNVGAGAGSYEPTDRQVVAVEPSPTMLAQRPPEASPAALGVAESLPLPDRSVDAAMAILTVHHWTDAIGGLAEMRRVAVRQIVLTWDPAVARRYWLVDEYLPQIADHEADLATLHTVVDELRHDDAGGSRDRHGDSGDRGDHHGDTIDCSVEVLEVPAACADGVMAAYWRRPAAYLDPSVRAAISSISLIDQSTVTTAMERLARDIDDGTWMRRHGSLLDLEQLDLGYRLVVAH